MRLRSQRIKNTGENLPAAFHVGFRLREPSYLVLDRRVAAAMLVLPKRQVEPALNAKVARSGSFQYA